MDNEQVIVDALSTISSRQNANHIEVVQRLTALETRIIPYDSLPPRVVALESWRGKVTGIFAFVSAVVSGGISLLAMLLRGKH